MNTNIKNSVNSNHRKQVFWQIVFPIILAVLVFLLIALSLTLPGFSDAVQNERFANISTVLLLLPVLFTLVLFLLIFSMLIWGIYKITVLIPVYSQKLLNMMTLVSDSIRYWTDAITSPILSIKSWLSVIGSINKISGHHSNH